MSVESKTVAQFQVQYTQFLDEAGNPTQELPAFAQDKDLLLKLYRTMCLTRTFDAKAIALQRTGKCGTYPSTLGQEAIGVAVGSAMLREDALCPYYRENGAQFWRGVRMEEILAYWGGDERGSAFSEAPAHDFPICVPIASQTLHAVGAATAFKYRKEKRAAVAFIGEGGTSRGDFYESVNVAGVWKLPVVFLVNNNQWAISVPREKQSAVETFAQKAFAGGIEGEQVDGNDVIAVRYAVENALAKARAGDGATVIEAITYRMCDHTTADDARRYRPEEEVAEQKKKDPIIRFRTFLANQGLWDESKEKALYEEITKEVAAAVAVYEDWGVQPVESMFDHLYETLPEALQEQRDELIEFGGK